MIVKNPKCGERYPAFDTVLRAFPSYRKHSVFLYERSELIPTGYCWDDESLTNYYTANLDGSDCKSLPVPNSPPPFCDAAPSVFIPDGRIILTRGVFCGKPATATIYSNPLNRVYWGLATVLGV